jgi:hypothetical protein
MNPKKKQKKSDLTYRNFTFSGALPLSQAFHDVPPPPPLPLFFLSLSFLLVFNIKYIDWIIGFGKYSSFFTRDGRFDSIVP